MRQVAEEDAKTTLGELHAEVEAGEVIVFTRDGKPIAELRQVEQPRKRTPAEVAASIRENRKGISLGGITIRELIEETRTT
jgi:antitoxin (DNA-binding transcriptional repressor) of toxin-antitoxin stability system